MSSQSDSNEEAYILEKKEISTDHDHSFEYKSVKELDEEDLHSQTLDFLQDEEDDLDDFDKLKAKTTLKQQLQTGEGIETLKKAELKPKVVK